MAELKPVWDDESARSVIVRAADELAGCLGRFPQLVAAGPGGPRKRMKIVEIGQNGSPGSGEIEISHGAIEAEQLFDPERA